MPNAGRALASLALVLLGAIVYWPGLSGGFIFDDYPNLVLDPDWKVTTLTWDAWQRAAGHGIASSFGRPLSLLSFAANHYFTGLDPGPIKLGNLVIHLANGLVVFALARKLLTLARSRAPAPGDWAAWPIAAVWLVHPLQVSTVLYVVQRMELGSQGLAMASLLTYVIARMRQREGRPAALWLGASALAWLAGLGFKESALLVPAYAFAMELCLLRFEGHQGRVSRPWVGLYGLALLAALTVYLFLAVPAYTDPNAYLFREFDLAGRLLSQPSILSMYLGQILWPDPDRLLFYYDHLRAPQGWLQPVWTLGATALLASLVAVAVFLRRRRPLASFGILLFLLGHALTSNIAPLELAFEHRNYLALLGVPLAIAGLLGGLAKGWEKATPRVLPLAIVAVLAALTYQQASIWGKPLNLSTTLSSRNPASVRASYALATDWYAIAGNDVDHPLWSLSLRELEHAASQTHGPPLGEQGQLVILAHAGREAPAGLWENLRRKLGARPISPEAESVTYNLVACRLAGCALDDRELQVTLATLVSGNPDSATLRVQYANFAFNTMRDPALAIALMRDAIQLEPEVPGHRAGLLLFQLASNLHDKENIAAEVNTLRAMNRDGAVDDELAQIEALLAAEATGKVPGSRRPAPTDGKGTDR